MHVWKSPLGAESGALTLRAGQPTTEASQQAGLGGCSGVRIEWPSD